MKCYALKIWYVSLKPRQYLNYHMLKSWAHTLLFLACFGCDFSSNSVNLEHCLESFSAVRNQRKGKWELQLLSLALHSRVKVVSSIGWTKRQNVFYCFKKAQGNVFKAARKTRLAQIVKVWDFLMRLSCPGRFCAAPFITLIREHNINRCTL